LEIDNNRNYYGAFITPHSDDKNQNNNNQTYIEDTIDGLFSQTDPDWCAIIVANKSTSKKDMDYLNHVKEKHYPKIDIIFL
jgi:hypothetical protein